MERNRRVSRRKGDRVGVLFFRALSLDGNAEDLFRRTVEILGQHRNGVTHDFGEGLVAAFIQRDVNIGPVCFG